MAVTSIDIKQRGPYAEGMSYGDVGAFEQLEGTVHFAVDPSDPANSLITDLELAPKNAAGLVEFSADFRIVRPVDSDKGSHTAEHPRESTHSTRTRRTGLLLALLRLVGALRQRRAGQRLRGLGTLGAPQDLRGHLADTLRRFLVLCHNPPPTSLGRDTARKYRKSAPVADRHVR